MPARARRTLDEQRDPERVLDGPAGLRGRGQACLHAARDVHPDGRDGQQRLRPTFGGVRPPARMTGHAAGHRGRASVADARRPVPPRELGSAVSRRIACEVGLRPVGARRARRRPSAVASASRASSSGAGGATLRTGSGMPSRSSGGSSPWSCTASRPSRAAMAATSSAGRSAKTPTSRGPAPGLARGPGQPRRAPPPLPPSSARRRARARS